MNGACLNRFLRALACLSGAGLFTASVTQADIVIDAFTPDDFQQVAIQGPSGPTTVTDVLQPAQVIGGAREIQLTRTSHSAALVSATVYNTVSYSSAQNAVGNALIIYNGGGAGLGNVDLTEGGTNNLIEVGVTSDLGANLIITVYTSPTQYSTATVPIPADPTFTPYYVSAYFTNISKAVHFTAAGPDGGATFGSVNAITAFIDGSTEAVDVLVNYFVATADVPPQGPPPPTIECADVAVQISKCATSAVVTYSSVVTVDPSCAPANVQYFPPSGSTFPVGTNAVAVTVTDACGQVATCNFDVIVTKEVCQPKPPCHWRPKPPCNWHPKPPCYNPPKPPCYQPKPTCHSGGGWFSSFFGRR